MSQVFRRFVPAALTFCLAVMCTLSAVQAVAQDKEQTVENKHVLTRDIFAKVLTAELALERDNPTRAFKEYFEAAQTTGYGELAQRALQTAEQAQDEERAQQALALWNRLDPNNDRALLFRLGDEYTKGNFDQAQAIATDLLSRSDNPESLLEDIHMIASGLSEKTRFYESFSKIAAPYAESSTVQLLLASAASQAKMGEKAKEHGIRAIELSPENPHILIQGADYEFKIDPKAASKRLELYLKDHPNNHQVRLSYAKSLLRTGEFDKIDKELAAIEVGTKDDSRILMILGMIAEQARLYGKAELYYKKFLVQIAKKPVVGVSADAAYVRLGMVKLNQGHKELAIDWFDKVQGGEQYVAARLKQAELLADSGRFDEACTVLRNIDTDDKTQKAEFCRQCASLLLKNGHKAQALEVLTETLDWIPQDSELLYQTALLAAEINQTQQSEALLRRFIELNPDNYNGYNSLGYLWISRGIHLEDAERMIVKAMDLSGGKNAYVLDSLGWLRHLQGKEEQAEKLLTQAQNIAPSDVEIALHLAEVLFIRGKDRQAEGVVRSVLEGEPDNAQAQNLLKANGITP